MRDQAHQLQVLLSNGHFCLEEFGRILDEGWQMKRNLASGISNDQIDSRYRLAIEAGAEGGKICGAGNGGFLLLLVRPERQDDVRQALSDLKAVPIGYEVHGSSVLMSVED